MGHFTREQVERLLESSLPREEIREVVRHLLTGCERCREIARQVAGEAGLLQEPHHSDCSTC